MPDRKQTHETKQGYGPGWTDTTVHTFESWDDSKIASKVQIKTKHDAVFVDIHLEEYTGETRRAKLCTARLEADAGRALYAQLKAIYE